MKSNKCFFMLFAVLLALFLGNKPAFCATYYVPDDYPTIQAAVDATWGGDTVVVRAGTYTGEGNKDILIDKLITVKSEEGSENTIIDCEGAGRGFEFYNVNGSAVLEGFQIINGSAGGIYCSYASPLIRNCLIKKNTAAGNYGGGMYLSYSNPKISNCVIKENTATGGHSGGGIALIFSYPDISDCQIIKNRTTVDGGGIFVSNGNTTTPFLLTNCALIGNSAGNGRYGGGIMNNYSSPPIITNCTFAWNSAGYGGGIYSQCSATEIRNSIFFYNGASQEIYIAGSTSNTVTYSNIMGGYTGEGNINENPEFVTGGDYHLSASSPCIDKASPDNAPDTDIDNELRPQGAGYDMGADEFDGIPAPPSSKADLNEDGVVDGLDVSILATEFGKIY